MMDEYKELVEQPEEKPLVRFSAHDWITLALSFALAALWFAVLGLEAIFKSRYTPAGLGTTLYVLALLALVLIRLGKRAVWNRTTAALLVVYVLLAINCFLYASSWTALVNCFILLFVGAMEFFALSGKLEAAVGSARAAASTIKLSFVALFANIGKPFRALGSARVGGKKSFVHVVVGLVCAIPVLCLVLLLLISADAVFESLFTELIDVLRELEPGRAMRKILRTAVLGLMLFSALYFLTLPAKEPRPRKEASRVSALPFITALTLLDAVYAVFVVIQFAFLFGGRETAAMSGGYAEYARTGFFQLVAVSAINLAAVLIPSVFAEGQGRGGSVLRVLGCVLLAFTVVILVSAAYRMGLYISVFGLSILRALTLLGIVFIAVLLVAAAVKLFVPRMSFWNVFLASGLCLWLVFSYSNVDARIAQYNVEGYISGRLERIDLEYLSQVISPESLPYVRELSAYAPDIRDIYGFDTDVIAQRIENDLLATVNWREATVTGIKTALN